MPSPLFDSDSPEYGRPETGSWRVIVAMLDDLGETVDQCVADVLPPTPNGDMCDDHYVDPHNHEGEVLAWTDSSDIDHWLCRRHFDADEYVREANRITAWNREEHEPCEANTVGCSVDHTAERDAGLNHDSCETW